MTKPRYRFKGKWKDGRKKVIIDDGDAYIVLPPPEITLKWVKQARKKAKKEANLLF